MINRGEMSQRIMSELEEAGAENVSCLLNTVILPKGDAVELVRLTEALEDLVRKGHALMASERPFGRSPEKLDPEISINLIKQIPELLQYDAASKFWGPKFKGRIPEVFVTPEGLKSAREILSERGYEWWMSSPD